jgi:hypothetical protein
MPPSGSPEWLLGGKEQNYESPVSVAAVPGDIRNKHLMNAVAYPGFFFGGGLRQEFFSVGFNKFS